MLELIYTASPKGLDPSRSGFVTVARTEGFPPNLISPLENLSGYKALYSPDDPSADKNPANYSYQRYGQGSGIWYVVSRITYAGLSYTGRSNNLAHHLLFSRDEVSGIPGGAAAVLADDRNFPAYEAPPHLLGLRRCHGAGASSEPRNGASWGRLCGNADWAYVVAERFRVDRTKGVVLQFTPGVHHAKDILDLVSDVVELLTPEEAIEFTFTTYCYQSTIGNPVFLRAYTADSPFLASIRRMNPHGVITLGEENPLEDADEAFLQRYQERLAFEHNQKSSNTAPRQLAIVESNAHSEAEVSNVTKHIRLSGHNRRSVGRHSALGGNSCEVSSASGKGGMRLFLVLGGVVLLAVLGFLGVLFWPRFFPGKPADSTVGDGSQGGGKSGVGPSVVRPENPEKSSPEVVPPGEEVGGGKEVPPEVPLPEKLDENLCFYEGFLLSRESSIPLPTKYAKGGVLTVELSGIGDKNALQEVEGNPCTSGENTCVVFSLKSDKSGISERLIVEPKERNNQLLLEIRDGKLLVQEPPAGELVPRRDNIMRMLIDGQVLYEREFSDALLAEFNRTEKIVGKVEYTPDRRLVGSVPEGTKRLGKYQEQLRLVANVLNGDKELLREIPVELRGDGIEFTIENFGEVSEINPACQKWLEAESALVGLKEKQAQFYREIHGNYQVLQGKIFAMERFLSSFRNMEIEVQEGKKKREEDVKMLDEAEAIRKCLSALDSHFLALENPKCGISQNLFKEELEWLDEVCQQLVWDMNNLRMGVPPKGENYLLEINNIQSVLNELRAIGTLVNGNLAKRLSIDDGIRVWQAEKAKNDARLKQVRPRVARKLRSLLSESVYVENFKAPLEDALVEIDLERMRDELLKACSVEYRFVKK